MEYFFLDWMYPWTGSRMGILVRASSQSESLYFNSMFLRLGGNLSACSTRRFISVSICRNSFCKRTGSVELVATICPGNVQTALKSQAPLRFPIQLVQTNSESKPNLVSWRSNLSNGEGTQGRSIQPSAISCISQGQSPIVEVQIQLTDSNSSIRDMRNTHAINHVWTAERTESARAAGWQLDGDMQGIEHRVDKTKEPFFFYCLKSKFWGQVFV